MTEDSEVSSPRGAPHCRAAPAEALPGRRWCGSRTASASEGYRASCARRAEGFRLPPGGKTRPNAGREAMSRRSRGDLFMAVALAIGRGAVGSLANRVEQPVGGW